MTAQPPPPPMNHGDGPPRRTDAAELADLYAAGGLSDAESMELDARVAAREPDLLAHLRRVETLADALARGFAGSETPPPEARARLLLSIHDARREKTAADEAEASLVQEMFADARAAAGMRSRDRAPLREPVLAGSHASPPFSPEVIVRRASDGHWWPTGLPGVWGKPLYKSRRADRETLLVRCDPGAMIPRHAHEGIEELIVLEGTLQVGDVLLRAGDYIRSMPGSDHGDAVSPEGCICLFFTSHGVMSPRSQVVMFLRAIVYWVRSRLGGGR